MMYSVIVKRDDITVTRLESIYEDEAKTFFFEQIESYKNHINIRITINDDTGRIYVEYFHHKDL